MKTPFTIKHKGRFGFSIIIIIVSLFFLVFGMLVIQLSDILEQYFELQEEKFEVTNEVKYHESEIYKPWLDEFEIWKNGDDPLEVGETLGFDAYVFTSIVPEDLVLHIFHSDMNDYVTGISELGYRAKTDELGKVPGVAFSDVFSVNFDLSECKKENNPNNCSFNGHTTIELKKPGTYFAQISIKINSTFIDHYKSSSSVMIIHDGLDKWVVSTLEALLDEAEYQRVNSYRSTGYVFLAIGISMLISALNVVFSSVDIKKKEYKIYR